MIRSLGGGIAQACRQALQQTGALPAVQTLRQYAQPADSHKRNLAEASSESSFGNIKIGQVMKDKAEHGGLTANMFWVKPEDKVFEAIKKMAEANVGSVLVLKSGKFRKDDVEGLITERDYLRKVAVTGKSSKEMSCGALMTPTTKIIDIEPHDTVAKAMAVMEERNIRHLPVYDGEELMGMLSIKDIVGTFMDQHATDVNSMSDYIAGGSW